MSINTLIEIAAQKYGVSVDDITQCHDDNGTMLGWIAEGFFWFNTPDYGTHMIKIEGTVTC